MQGPVQAQDAGAAEGVAAMPGSRQCAVEDTVQAEDTPPWLSEQVIALALDNVMMVIRHMGIDLRTTLA